MAKFTGGTAAIDFFNFDAQLEDLDDGTVTKATTTQFRRDEVIPTDYTDIFGTKLAYDGSNNLTGGTVNRIVSFDTALQWDLSSLSMQAVTLNGLIAAGDGDDFLTAVFALNDSITGSTGNDTLHGFAGNDTLNGGKGDDVFHVDDNKDVVVESLTFAAGGGIDLVISKGTFTLGTNVDKLQLVDGKNADGTGNAIDNTLTGNSSDNKLSGLAGNDSLSGGAGKDTLDGGTGDDTMDGGEGDDFYVVDTLADQNNIIESGSSTGDTLKTNQLLVAPIAGIEHYIFTGTKAITFDAAGAGSANNSITGTAAADSIAGGGGNDTVLGLAGNDTLNGFGGDDVLDGGAGIDEMRSGTGNDTYVVDNAKDFVFDSGGDLNDTIRASITVTLASFPDIENIELTGTGAINATGDGFANKLIGNTGANKLDGLGGDDIMDGGKGNDTYTVDSTGDQVSETDTLTGGTDTVLSTATFTLTGAIENLTLLNGGLDPDIDAIGNALVNTLTGNDGKNLLDGGAKADKLIGGKGDDTYIVDDLKDTVTESAALLAGGGVDLVKSSVTFTLGTNVDKLELTGTNKADGTGNTLDNTLTGNVEANKLSGLTGNDSLLGAGGNDTLDGGTNTATAGDTMDGGEGDDLYIVDSALDQFSDSGSSAGDQLKTSQLLDKSVTGIEHYIFTGTKSVVFTASNDNTANSISGTSAADAFLGMGGNDTLIGLAGNDSLVGDAGNDSLDGGAGLDTMDGGAGDDSYTVDNVKDAINDTDGTNDTVVASVSFDLSTFDADIENASLTGTGALNLTGDGGVNKLTGNAGANKIDGREGADDMTGGAGSDTYTVDNLGDKVTETDSKGGTDLVLSSVDYTLGAFLENLTLTDIKDINGKVTNDVDGIGNELNNLIIGNGAANILTALDGKDTLTGNDGDDSLAGGKGADSLSGGGGNDTLDGGADADTKDTVGDKMAGGAGDDTYFVNTAFDSVTEAANAGRDTIKTTVGVIALTANVEDLVLLKETTGVGNTADNKITGSDVSDTSVETSGDDFINGLAGNDTLWGMGGDDTLIGFTGDDSIDGGDGLDVVQFAGKIDDYLIELDGKGGATVTDLKAAVNGNDGKDVLVNVESLVFFGDKSPVTFQLHAQGTPGNDTVVLTSAPDGFDGLAGNDSIDGDGGPDTLEGNGGNDTLVGGTGDDQLKGGTETDQYNHAGTAADGNDVVFTGDTTTTGLDKLVFTGSNLFDFGFIRDGPDLLVGALKSGQTTFDGSVRIVDHYGVAAAAAAIASVEIDTLVNGLYGTNANLAKFVFTTDLDSGLDNNTSFTEVLLGSDKSDVINGNGGFLDVLAGNAGNDTLKGGAGNDWLSGGAGNDVLDGGTGINTVDYSKAAAAVTMSLLAGTAVTDGDGGQDTLTGIQKVVGSAFGDDITGDGGANTLEGGAGNDILDGGAGIDQADYSRSTFKVTVDLTDGLATGDTSVDTDTLVSIERVLGSQFSDTMFGNAAIFAELTGSKGNDTIDGAGNGYASYYDSPGAVTASLATGKADDDGWGTKDTLSNLDGLTGSAFADKLTGSADANTLDGGAGNDTITGGFGNDSIVGGLGDDTAVFSGKSVDYLITDLGGGKITVKDLNTGDGNDGTDTLSGIDALQFSDQVIDETNSAPVNSVPAAQATNEDTKLTFNSANKNLISISDSDADGADVQVILDVDHGLLTLATTAGLTSVVGNGTATVTLVGTVTEINAALNGLGFAPTSNFNGGDTLTITTNDLGNIGIGGPLEDKDTVAITINSVNDAPVASTASASGNEDAASIPITLTGTDVDGTIASVTLTSLPANGTLYTNAGLTTLAAIGTPYAGSSVTLYFVPNLNFNGAPTFQFTVTDNEGGSDATPATATITVNAVNDAPVNTVPGAQTTNEDTALTFTGANAITIADVDAGGSDVEVTLTVTSGTLDVVNIPAGLVLAGDNSANVTLTGTVAEINAALDGLKFNPTANANGAVTLTVLTDDNGFTGTGGAKSDSDNIIINVTAVNDAPVNTVPGAQTTNEDTALTFTGANAITIADVDAGGSDVEVTLTVTSGTLDVVNIPAGLVLAGDNSANVTLTGTVAEINAALDGLKFNPTANANGAVTLTVLTDDNGFTGTGGAKSDSDNIIINVTAVNDAPVNTVPGAQTTNEDTALTFTGANAITIADVDAGGSDVEVTLTVTSGTLDVVNIPAGLVLAGDNSANVTLTGTVAEINAALDGLKFNPTANANGAVTLTVLTDDNGFTGTGGAKSDSDNIIINVTAVNDAPVNTVPGAQTTNEDTTLTFGAGKLITIADVDAGGSDVEVTLAVANGTLNVVDAAGLGIVGDNSGNVTLTGTLAEINAGLNGMIFTPTGNFNGSTELTVTTDDQGATGTGGPLTDVDKITINVTAVDDPLGPVTDANGTANTVAENATNGTVIAITAHAVDPDATDTVTYSLDDSAGGRFAINATSGVVSVANGLLLDFEAAASHDITVKATSSGGGSTTKDFTITLTDVTDETVSGSGGDDKLMGGIGDDSLSGNGGNDTLIGGADNNSLLGGANNNSLDGGAGTDNLLGGAGDDTLVWDSADSALDGGDDNDTLLVQSGALDLTGVTSVTNIEQIDLSAGDHALTLTVSDVLAVTDASDTLTILGGTGDTANIGVGDWLSSGPVSGFVTYTQGGATLVVSEDIAVT